MKKSLKKLSILLALVIALSIPSIAYAATCPNDGTYLSVYSQETYHNYTIGTHQHLVYEYVNGKLVEVYKPCTLIADVYIYHLRCSMCGYTSSETGNSAPTHVY